MVFKDFRERAGKAGYELFLAGANKNLIPGFHERDKELYEKTIDALGLDTVMTYTWPHIRNHWPDVKYSAVRENYFNGIDEEVEFSKVTVCMTVSTGWYSSPRTVKSDMYEDTGYPFLPIQVNNTPKEVGKSFEMAKEMIDSGRSNGKICNLFGICTNHPRSR